jgi:hypothetical protein
LGNVGTNWFCIEATILHDCHLQTDSLWSRLPC